MYQNIYYEKYKNTIHLWDDKEGYLTGTFTKYGYVIDKKGEYTTIFGEKVKRIEEWSDTQIKQNVLYEHDVPVLTRVLVDRYHTSAEVSEGHTVLCFDIEIIKGEKYSEPKDALNVINAISAWDSKNKKYYCWILDEDNKITSTDTLFSCKTETDLLVKFLSYWNKTKPTIVTGWNIKLFDIPYLINRCYQKLGKITTNKFSPIGIVMTNGYVKKDSDDDDNKSAEYKIAGITIFDYLDLYKQYTYSEESSYTLEAISQKELKRGKVQYDGSLDTLLETDINKFIEYNINDVELVVALDAKLDFIEIARGIAHKGHIPYEDVFMASRLVDGAILSYCKVNDMIAPAIKKQTDSSEAIGAFVKQPKPDIYHYVYDLDLESMYPGNIRTLNISPETKWGKILNWDEKCLTRSTEVEYNFETYRTNTIGDDLFGMKNESSTLKSTEVRQFLETNNLSIASNGVMYDKTKKGLIPTILTTWFLERKEFSKTAADFKIAGDIEKYRYYDKKQLVQKILLNSVYGVLLMQGFRFYDKDNGEAVTTTGQSLIKFAITAADMFYNKKLKTEGESFVLYSDTDSIFYSAIPLIDKSIILANDDAKLVEETLKITSEIQDFINKSFNYYAAKFHNVTDHVWYIKQELVARRAFWGNAKKRYAMWIVNKKGLPVDELEVKGLDTVRSSYPKSLRVFFRQLIIDILNDKTAEQLTNDIKDFKHIYNQKPLNDVLSPTGVKEISKYRYGQKGTPIHVKSAQNYNKLLEILNLESYPKFNDGDKILWAYLKSNSYGFDTIAIRGYQDPPELIEFIERFINKDFMFENSLISKLEVLFDELGFGKLIINNQNNDFF